MWFTLRMASQAKSDFIASATDLLNSMARALIYAIGGLYFVWHLGSIATWPAQMVIPAWTTMLAVAPVFFLSLLLLKRHFLVAQGVWLCGLAAAMTLAIYAYQEPGIGFAYSFLPLIAVVTVGWPAALLAEGLVAALLGWLAHSSSIPPLPSSLIAGILCAGAVAGLLGWIATHTLLTVTEWSLLGFEQARKSLEEARDQRVELKQTQADLIHANQELARLADRLQVMQQAAQEARQAKEAFVANVSHELRTPLNMIIGFSEMITEAPQVYGAKLPPALLADITAIQRNSQHLSKLVDDVLDLSQVEAGRMALSKEWASLWEITEAAVLSVRALFESKGLYLETDVPADLPPLFCDSTRIRQVVINLLSNAGRFTERGGVRLKAWRKDGEMLVSVADTGPGISPEGQKKLFEPFQQLDGSIRRRHGGSGLGLSISKRFVEMHGGKMWLESRLGEGTTFYFSLPSEATLTPTLPEGGAMRWFSPYHDYQDQVRTRRSRAPASAPGPRYVLLEEEDALQRQFSRYLAGTEIASVRNIREAIDELERSPAQALVVNAPLLDESPAALGQLADLPYGTPAVTCWVPGEGDAARRLGVARYLVKPVTRTVLLSALESLGEGIETVLLVDDERGLLQLFTRMLTAEKPGYRVLQATDGQRALALLRERRPDAMLLDLLMPEMDGYQLLREKSRDPAIRDIPVVAVSSRDPTGEPAVSEKLMVMRSGGLSVPDVLACIRAVSEALSPVGRPERRERPEKHAS